MTEVEGEGVAPVGKVVGRKPISNLLEEASLGLVYGFTLHHCNLFIEQQVQAYNPGLVPLVARLLED